MYACTYVDHQFLFYTPPGVPEDANLTIESRFIQLKKVDSFDLFSHIHTYIHTAIHRAILLLDLKKLPPRLHLNLDNCWAANKNHARKFG